MNPVEGNVRFYERTEHIKDSAQRFAAAVELRKNMKNFLENPITGGDVWFKPRLSEI